MDPKRTFAARQLKGKLLGALQQTRAESGEDAISAPVMGADELRTALADTLGDEVPSKDLFPLMQLADPDSEGVITMPRFLEVVQLRKEQVERERRQAQLTRAYQALGGTADRDVTVKSDLLVAIATDFVGPSATKAGMGGVVGHRKKALDELLGMGGELDSDDEAEMKDTAKLTFGELAAFGAALGAHGEQRRAAEEGAAAADAAAQGAEEAGGAGGGAASVLR